MKGVPLYVVGKAMGHKTLTMTQRYSHLAPGSLDEAFQAVADFRKDSLADKENNVLTNDDSASDFPSATEDSGLHDHDL